MIYIGTQAEGGCGIYLDVHAEENHSEGREISAVIGDGSYEGEVLIVCGRGFEVTFVDALWGDVQGLRDFLECHGEEKIRADLHRALTPCEPYEGGSVVRHATRPHVYLPLFSDPGVVAETGLAQG